MCLSIHITCMTFIKVCNDKTMAVVSLNWMCNKCFQFWNSKFANHPVKSWAAFSSYILRSTASLFCMDQRLLQNPVGFAVAISMHQSQRILGCSLRSWQVHWVHGENSSTKIWLASALMLAGPTVPTTASTRVAWACGRVRDKQMLPPASWCQPRDKPQRLECV